MQNIDIDFLTRGFHLDKNGSVKISVDEGVVVSGWWTYGNLVHIGDNFYIVNESCSLAVEDWSIGKCVGLCCSDHPVFTHDIISYRNDIEEADDIGEVIMVNQCIRIDGKYWATIEDVKMENYYLDCEVIGNIYENPEKLNQGE